jgi:hypothetical protein
MMAMCALGRAIAGLHPTATAGSGGRSISVPEDGGDGMNAAFIINDR